MLTLAHLSDVHIGPLPRAESWRDYLGKRIIGKLSWQHRRRFIHDPAVAAAMVADIRAAEPDHVALTGDLINIALAGEFTLAAEWLKAFGPPDWITVVPGNHDAYRPFPYERGAGLWAPYMTGDMRLPGQAEAAFGTVFPFVRQRRNVALIGVSTAVPQNFFRAGGSLGKAQIDALAEMLRELRRRGYYRAILIHHPPVPGLTSRRRALDDAQSLKLVLEEEGADLVLHGHNHRHERSVLSSRHGPVNIIGAPSASAPEQGKYDAAAWYFYRIKRQDGAWQTEVTMRGWDVHAKAFVQRQTFAF